MLCLLEGNRIKIWICKNCGHANIDEWKNCYNCETKQPQTKREMKCWEYMNCEEDKRNNCMIYNYNYGDKCWIVANEIKKCKKSNTQCDKCPWYQYLKK